jgi:formyltetrahydrofolate-dependent phosphoribosylglycinamide formyltransferase/phosphoribosylaminoimidazole-succinocarboxamide synthase
MYLNNKLLVKSEHKKFLVKLKYCILILYLNITNYILNKMSNIVVFASGSGTNFDAIVQATLSKVINGNVKLLICNNENAGVVKLATDYGIPVLNAKYTQGSDRSTYYDQICQQLFDLDYDIDLIVLAGWMLIVSPNFIDIMEQYKCSMINLHPALPGQFPGINAINRAWKSYQNNEITESGLMVHYVASKLDGGEVIDFKIIPFYPDDTFESFKQRLQWFEKPTLLGAINKVLTNHTSNITFNKDYESIKMAQNCDHSTDFEVELAIKGKVRDCFSAKCSDITQPYLIIYHSDRLSAFDHHICNVNGKGNILMLQNIWWMHQTEHIIRNHYINHNGNSLIVDKCQRIPIEVVVRGYITGSTSTSLWTHYNKGVRNYCGNNLPEGLVKNQKLENYLITPTTKDIEDKPISPQEIVESNLLSQTSWDYIADKAMQLFKYGSQIADEKNLILVDTKYEFGFDCYGEIILVDEIHTSDSSRYWLKSTYQERFDNGQEPEKLDKDAIRDWLTTNSNPRDNDFIPPEIPNDVKDSVFSAYQTLYETLTGIKAKRIASYDENNNDMKVEQYWLAIDDINNSVKHIKSVMNTVIIMAGSVSDADHVLKIVEELSKVNIMAKVHYASAHRETDKVKKILDGYNIIGNRLGTDYIYVTVAGMSNALSGVVAANVNDPVIACPPFKDKIDMIVDINSTLRCPKGVPVMTVLNTFNVAQACYRIFNMK